MRATFIAMGKESLFKKLNRSVKLKIPLTPRLQNDLITILPPFFRDDVHAAFNGDETVSKRLDAMGLWESFLKGAFDGPEIKWPAHRIFTLKIERACAEPFRLFQANQFGEAAARLVADPLMKLFLWPEALAAIKSVQSKESLLPLQASVMIEIHLSILAGLDVDLESMDEGRLKSRFSCLLPTRELNPTSLFFRWLQEEAGTPTIQCLFNDSRLRELSVDMGTLKRWSNGSHQPGTVWLQLISQSLFGQADHELLWQLNWATRYFNLLGYLAQRCTGKAQRLLGTPKEGALAPWPKLPFGIDSIESWFQNRYPVWLDYHRSLMVR